MSSNSKMDSTTQSNFMYLFERLGEPLYMGPRGNQNVYYMVPMGPNMDDKTMSASVEVRRSGPVSKYSVNINQPSTMPDLSTIGRLCSKSTLFSYFSERHLDAAVQLKSILMNQKTRDNFLSMSAVCRDHPMVNPHLWLYAVSSCALERKDMRGFKIPAFVEICPDMFITPSAYRLAQKEAEKAPEFRKKIEVIMPQRNDLNPESSLSYFREDIGLNSHHWHWHLVYDRRAKRGDRDRKGELFYYMHNQLLRRYNTERLGNNLGLTRALNIDEDNIPEGYFPKLYDTNSGQVWGTRQSNSKLVDIERVGDSTAKVQDLRTWRDRILEAIDVGFVLDKNRTRIPLTIDVLGDIVEPSMLSPNETFYGGLHDTGHDILRFAHDPKNHHGENMGVIGSVSTAMRDPLFYRWHMFVDEIFEKLKSNMPPYKLEELIWDGIEVSKISVKSSEFGGQPNILYTNWLQSDVDLARGVDFGRRGPTNTGPVWAVFTHLNHIPFTYQISVNSKLKQAVPGTIRVFLAPKLNERGRRSDLTFQRKLFFEMDKFSHTLKPGTNDIIRESKDSSVTIPFAQTFKQLEELRGSNDQPHDEPVCGCGLPSSLLLPKSTVEGLQYDLYIIVTNGSEDQIQRKNPRTTQQQKRCKESLSYCGILDDFYPDKRPMGFPWDRPIAADVDRSLHSFTKKIPNSHSVEIRIIHRDEKKVRPGGAPPGMTTIKDESNSRPSSPSPNGSRGGTPPRLREPEYPTVPSNQWPWRPSSPNRGRKPKFESYNPDGFSIGGQFNLPSRWRSGRETSPGDDEDGWTHV